MPRKTQVEVGKRYGKLVVVKELGTVADSKNRKRLLWECLCDCGKTTQLTSYRLITRTKSCGCLLFEHKNTYKGIGNLSGSYWTSLKNGAKKRKIDFDLNIKDAYDLLVKQNFKCALTSLPIELYRNDIGNTASLDRINPKIGYQLDNIQWLLIDINFMKQDFDNEQIIDMCHLIAKNHPKSDGV